MLVTRTFSKMYGLAAERIGWAYGHADIITALHRIRLPFSVSIAGHGGGGRGAGRRRVRRAHGGAQRPVAGWFTAEIGKLGNAGLRAVPSHANFVLVLFEGAS